MILAIDPGNEESAYVLYEDLFVGRGTIYQFGKLPNLFLRDWILSNLHRGAPLAIEMIASYGMAVGASVFDTCMWIGRFIEAHGGTHTRVFRQAVKLHLCHDTRAKDGNIRQAIIDRYGGKETAIGKKKTPGPLYGIADDVWSALAVAITHSEAPVKAT